MLLASELYLLPRHTLFVVRPHALVASGLLLASELYLLPTHTQTSTNAYCAFCSEPASIYIHQIVQYIIDCIKNIFANTHTHTHTHYTYCSEPASIYGVGVRAGKYGGALGLAE